MHEKRLVDRLTTYWNTIKKDRPLPLFEHFNPHALDDVWEYCFQLRVEPSTSTKRQYCYDFVGPKIVEAYGMDLTGKHVNASTTFGPGAVLLKKMDEIIINPVPQQDFGQFVNDKSKIVKYRSCSLPFGNEANGVTHIIVGVSWKSF